jgi:hypothetical protein
VCGQALADVSAHDPALPGEWRRSQTKARRRRIEEGCQGLRYRGQSGSPGPYSRGFPRRAFRGPAGPSRTELEEGRPCDWDFGDGAAFPDESGLRTPSSTELLIPTFRKCKFFNNVSSLSDLGGLTLRLPRSFLATGLRG